MNIVEKPYDHTSSPAHSGPRLKRAVRGRQGVTEGLK